MKRVNPFLHSFILFCGLMLVSQGGCADVFKRVDASGRIFYTDEPTGQQYKLIFRTPKKSHSFNRMKKNRDRFSPIISKISREYNVDSSLMHALIRTESAYNPDAISKAGAVGLMQLMPGTAKRYGVTNRHNPTENIRGGIQYFRDLLKQFNADVRLALAAYNAGENAVIRYGNKIPPYPETQNYVTKVMAFYKS